MEVVGSFEGSVGYPSGGVVGQDLFSPGDDGVHDLVVFGYLAGGVEVSEPSERLVGLVRVVGFVELVELLKSVPSGSETGMSVEDPVEMCLVGFGEVVGPAQEGEAGSEQVRLERWGPQLRIAALYLASYQGESLGEPAHDVEPVEHMASVGQILRDGLGGMGGIRR